MRSSIFSFERLDSSLNPSRAIVVLLAGVLLYLVALEVVTSMGMRRSSQGAKRQHEDYKSALALRPTTQDGRQTILVVGNSLVVAGVDRKTLIAEMSPTYSVSFWPIENTTYLDWYFGLRRLFAEGARPSAVVLCLSPRQLTSNSVNGEGFAHQMMQLRDIPLVMRTARLDTTTTSAFFFANLSAWLGQRASIRNWILESWLPNASLLASSLTSRVPPVSETEKREMVRIAEYRLSELRDLSAPYGARLLFLVPPLTSRDGLPEQISLSAVGRGLSVLIPYLPGEMPSEFFSDGFHLNSRGASLFTNRLGTTLQSSLR